MQEYLTLYLLQYDILLLLFFLCCISFYHCGMLSLHSANRLMHDFFQCSFLFRTAVKIINCWNTEDNHTAALSTDNLFTAHTLQFPQYFFFHISIIIYFSYDNKYLFVLIYMISILTPNIHNYTF